MKTSRKEYNGKTLAVVVAALAAVLMLFLAGCTMGTGGGNGSKDDLDDKKETGAAGVDYENYSTSDYVVKVKNNTTKSLVVFKGEPSAANLMGGVPASATNHGLKKNSSLFSTSSDFVLFFVTEEDYLAHKDNLSNLKTKPFARLYAYYNTNAANNFVYEVSSIMGGTGKIRLNNSTPYAVELRRNGIHGEVVGYAGRESVGTELYVNPGNYYLYPVFRKFDERLGEIVSVYPKYQTGNAAGKSFVTAANVEENGVIDLQAGNWLTEDVTFTNGYAYLKIESDVGENAGAINFYPGAIAGAESTSETGSLINSGHSYIYFIEMTQVGEQSYSEARTVTSLQYGSDIKKFTIPANEYKAGYLYTFRVTGSTLYDLEGTFEGNGQKIDDGFKITN